VEKTMADSNDDMIDIIFENLAKAKTIFDALNQVLNQGSSQARRFAWVLHKGKITRLREDLKDIRENLSLSLSTYLMSELPLFRGGYYND
jgi:hypothetical protein